MFSRRPAFARRHLRPTILHCHSLVLVRFSHQRHLNLNSQKDEAHDDGPHLDHPLPSAPARELWAERHPALDETPAEISARHFMLEGDYDGHEPIRKQKRSRWPYISPSQHALADPPAKELSYLDELDILGFHSSFDGEFSPEGTVFDVSLEEEEATEQKIPGPVPFVFDAVYRALVRGKAMGLHHASKKDIWELANRAVLDGKTHVLETIARCILNTVPIHTSKIPILFLRTFISHFKLPTMLELYKMLRTRERAIYLSAFFVHPSIRHDSGALLALAQLFSPTTEVPTDRIWPVFELLYLLIKCGQRHSALDLFQKLLVSGHIPPEAMRPNPNARDFTLIIYKTTVRSFMYWSMPRQAALFIDRIFMHLNEAGVPLDTETNEIVLLVLDALVAQGGKDEVLYAADLFNKLVRREGASRVPDLILHKLYEACRTLRQPEAAKRVYVSSQVHVARAQYMYAPPRGPALSWLLLHLTQCAKDEYHARMLVEQVVDTSAPVAPATRASFIMLAAEQGFALPARRLWEKYATGRFGSLVVANAGLLVRMCSLFSSLARDEHRAIDASGRRGEDTAAKAGSRAISGPADDNMISADREARPIQPLELFGVPDEFPGGGAEQSPSGALLDWEADVATSHDTPGAEREHEEEHARTSMRDRMTQHDSFVAFARRVLAAYRTSKEPLERASREDLNALARAYFVLGDAHAGFDALSVITKRAQVPDQYDINVAVGAVAAEDPAVALRMIEQTVRRRRRPDSVTIGTILQHALRKRRFDIAEDVLQFAVQHSVPLDLKTVEGLVRQSLTFSRRDPEAMRDNLRRALQVLRDNAGAPWLGRADLAEVCARAAARAGEGALAYEFWFAFVRRRAEWHDRQQNDLRRVIAGAVVRQRREIGGVRAHAMLSVLQSFEGKPSDGVGTAEASVTRSSEAADVAGIDDRRAGP
jgi:hypothetical protein